MSLLLPHLAQALIFASPDTEPSAQAPPDFPYWENLTQRRYEGPSVVYLGRGHALTARHVGVGEIFLQGEIYEPMTGSKRTLLNESGSAADAMVFQVEDDPAPPDLPVIPIAETPPQVGEEVLFVGFGRGREKSIPEELDGEIRFVFEWSEKGAKRWGTNRIERAGEQLRQQNFVSWVFSTVFDEPFSATATEFEAHAAVGDSGGGVFVKRGGEWQLAGLMVSISTDAHTPQGTSTYGDITHIVSLSHYRDQILRWTRDACSNEMDDDGDEAIDFPDDPGCTSPEDRNERDSDDSFGSPLLWLAALVALVLAGFRLYTRRSQTRNDPADLTD